MATLKLKKSPPKQDKDVRPARAPVRGQGSAPRKRPTLSQAQAARAEREARYQEQLRQRFGDKPPVQFVRRDEPGAFDRPKPAPRRSPMEGFEPGRGGSNTAFSGRGPSQGDLRGGQPQDDRGTPHRTDPRLRRDDRRAAAPRNEPDLRRDATRPAPHRFEPDVRRDDQRSGSRRTEPAARRDENRGQQQRIDPGTRQARPAPMPSRGRDDQRPAKRRGGSAFDRHQDRDDDHNEPQHVEIPGSMRLSKRMSELGIASRREADEWIAKGWVRVDDQIVSELGSRVLPHQRITVDAKAKFQQAQRVTVLINKPVGYVSGQAEDGYEPAVVLVTPDNQWREDRSGIRFLREHLRSLAPAGRLDIDSVGLLVLTQDGRVAKQLIGDDSDTEKEYLVRVQTVDGGKLPDDKFALLNHGLELDGEALRPAQVEWINDDQLRFVLKEGKKRQIRRMCEAVGLKVLGLKRVRIGKVMLGDLPPGQWRYLRLDESFA
ncbi:MAG: rRNA pseudouridine synthase [Burkholderiales bacterium]|nr:rRNA pseudouridine synthase [Burkholderiales bacterium]